MLENSFWVILPRTEMWNVQTNCLWEVPFRGMLFMKIYMKTCYTFYILAIWITKTYCKSNYTLQMRIPTEHFTATPVFALSPSSNTSYSGEQNQYKSMIIGSTMQSAPHQKPPPPQFTSLCVANCQNSAIPKSTQREKKISLPASLGLLGPNNLQSVGSAPSSPTMSRSPSSLMGESGITNHFVYPSTDSQSSKETVQEIEDTNSRPSISTIFGSITTPTSGHTTANSSAFVHSTPGVVLRNKTPRDSMSSASKYATLPRK